MVYIRISSDLSLFEYSEVAKFVIRTTLNTTVNRKPNNSHDDRTFTDGTTLSEPQHSRIVQRMSS